MEICLSQRLPKDFDKIQIIPRFSKPRSASNPKSKLLPLSESLFMKSKQKPRTSKEEFKVQINNKSSNWSEVRVIGRLLPARSYHSMTLVGE